MNRIISLRCIECGAEYDIHDRIFTCRRCGGLLDVVYDYEAVEAELERSEWRRRPLGVWRYEELLPILKPELKVTMGEGGTRLIRCRRLGEELGLQNLYVKFEGGNPTGSFKDRGMTVGVTKALEFGSEILICASTGNTAASLAAYSARAGLKCLVILPRGKVALGKLAQASIHGAKIIAVRAGFDEALNLVRRLAEKPQYYLLNSINPYRLEGQKTAAYEVWEQLGGCPDWLIIPVGNAGNISAYWKGFNELVILGMAESKPHMIGVQAEGAKPIVNAFNSGASIIKPLSQVETVATAIRIGNPVNWRRALNAIRESGGLAEAVSDDEILEAQRLLASKEGIFVEPASATPIAYLIKAMNEGSLIERDDKVVCIATGHGLKDPQIAIKQSSKPIEVDANIDEVEKVLGKVL